MPKRPDYDRFGTDMREARGPLAYRFSKQILDTTKPFRTKAENALRVIDVGSGYGHTTLALAERVDSVVGIEPNKYLHKYAAARQDKLGVRNSEFRCQSILELEDRATFDLAVLDNVLEHILEQRAAIRRVVEALVPGGVIYLLTPNRLWPIEVHYGLPFLSYLPLGLANIYLRLTGRGEDYADASHAPTYWSLKRMLAGVPEVEFEFALPANLRNTMLGSRWHYRLGAEIIRRSSPMWILSKSLLMIGVKTPATTN